MAVAAVDANVLVGLLDARDKWHAAAVALRSYLEQIQADIVYFDCVVNESISVLARRTYEQKRSDQLGVLLDRLASRVPVGDITWISGESQRLHGQIVERVRESSGALNYNDVLIALVCRDRGIRCFLTFDRDFVQFDWLAPVETVEMLQEVLPRETGETD